MAIDLGVLLNHGVKVEVFRKGIQKTLFNITGASLRKIDFFKLINGQQSIMAEEESIAGNFSVIVRDNEFDIQASLYSTLDIEQENKFLCLVSSEYSRSSMELVLVVSCAIWLAKDSQTQILDEWDLWETGTRVSPNNLENSLAIKDHTSFSDACFRIAADKTS